MAKLDHWRNTRADGVTEIFWRWNVSYELFKRIEGTRREKLLRRRARLSYLHSLKRTKTGLG